MINRQYYLDTENDKTYFFNITKKYIREQKLKRICQVSNQENQ